jgi:hypothetical protein
MTVREFSIATCIPRTRRKRSSCLSACSRWRILCLAIQSTAALTTPPAAPPTTTIRASWRSNSANFSRNPESPAETELYRHFASHTRPQAIAKTNRAATTTRAAGEPRSPRATRRAAGEPRSPRFISSESPRVTVGGASPATITRSVRQEFLVRVSGARSTRSWRRSPNASGGLAAKPPASASGSVRRVLGRARLRLADRGAPFVGAVPRSGGK